MISRATRLAVTLVVFFLLIVGAISANIWMTHQEISNSQRQWCDTLSLLTSHPVPYPSDAAKNPSRLATYQLYEDFVKVGERFGCRPTANRPAG
jgi:hypothetical protein